MYLFSRSRTIDPGRLREAMGWCAEVTAHVNRTTSLSVSMWNVGFGAPLGTVTWSCRLDSQAQLAAAGDVLQADDKYLQMLEDGAPLFLDPGVDRLLQIVHAANPSEEVKPVALVTTAEVAPGRIREAMAWGVEITDFIGGILGTPLLFGAAAYGPFTGVAWIGTADSMEQMDETGAQLLADPGYLERLDAGGGLFAPGVQRMLMQRVV